MKKIILYLLFFLVPGISYSMEESKEDVGNYLVRTYNSAAKVVLRNAATTQEAYYVDNQTYTYSLEELTGNMYGLFISDGVTLQIIDGDTRRYTLVAFHKNGDKEYKLKGPGGVIESYPKGLMELLTTGEAFGTYSETDFGNPLSSDDPWIGIWKLNFEKSKLPAAYSTDFSKSFLKCREINPDTLELTSIRVLTNGSKMVVWQCTVPKGGGIQAYQQGGPGNGVLVVKTIINDRMQYVTFLMEGKQVALTRLLLSEDGMSYTLSSGSLIQVFEKQ